MPIRVKMTRCWKSHVTAHILKTEEMTDDSHCCSTVLRIRLENVGVTIEIKFIKIEKQILQKEKI